jgi:hypothetical protein
MPKKLWTGFTILFCFCFFLLGSIVQRSSLFVLDVEDGTPVQGANRELAKQEWMDVQDSKTVVARRALLDRLMLEEEENEDDEEDKGQSVLSKPIACLPIRSFWPISRSK